MAIHAPIIAFVFRPGGIKKDNVYTDWATLVGKMNGVEGRKILEFDDSLSSPCEVPPGTWNMRDVVWAGYGPRRGSTRSIVVIKKGAILEEFRMIGGQITIDNQATATSPVSDFVDDVVGGPPGSNHIQMGMRDDCGNAQLLNSGSAPLFDLGNPATGNERKVFFFCQNSLLNVRFLPREDQDKNPLVTHGGKVDLTFNFIGQNQTGEKLVRSTAPARLGALSSATQIAAELINDDKNDFAPVTRIQRKVQPPPPKPPARSMADLSIGLPNALLRCDGNGTGGSGFTVKLPQIVGGFAFNLKERIPMYTGGQEIVIAEIAGGANLKVAGSGGDTIDGSAAPVQLLPNQSRTFASDGLKNWITIGRA